jgi:hypothetical protein
MRLAIHRLIVLQNAAFLMSLFVRGSRRPYGRGSDPAILTWASGHGGTALPSGHLGAFVPLSRIRRQIPALQGMSPQASHWRQSDSMKRFSGVNCQRINNLPAPFMVHSAIGRGSSCNSAARSLSVKSQINESVAKQPYELREEELQQVSGGTLPAVTTYLPQALHHPGPSCPGYR